ncbi:MAG: ATP-binding cassette domain-containing protein [Clostridia bacterium]|nr:ATP-binding cassette domain-containing protein [Clostridia bacterium]
MEEKITVKEAKKQYKANNGRITAENVNGFVVLKDINKVYGNRVQAVFNFNLAVEKNEFIVLVGPSGCGKSTTLRMIAGLEEITDGRLYIDNVLANYLESKDRDIAMVFQSYALYPNMSVYDNIGFGLQVRGLPKEEIKQRVFKAAEILDLGSYLDRKPRELSGGQMQRVALGRAIVRDAKLFLMDEPLSNLDAKLRVQMRSEIVKLHRSIGATTIYVTHDQTEAMTMADRIVIMNKGLVQQIGSPIEVYNNPANVFVATFIGSPPMNVFGADISGGRISDGEQSITLPKGVLQRYQSHIAQRRAFFEQLALKARLTEEKQLLGDISALVRQLKRLPPEQAKTDYISIVNRTLALARDKGFIHFGQEQAQSYLNDAEAGNISVILSNLAEIEKLIKNTDLAVSGLLKEVDSSNMRAAKKDAAVVKKQSVFSKIKRLFSKKSAEETLEEENLRKINEYLASYQSEEVATHALVGIRPEDVYFEGALGDNASSAISTRAELVELLGSEFCMHVNMFGASIIVKRGVREVVSAGSPVRLQIDMDKLKIFDPVSGKTV